MKKIKCRVPSGNPIRTPYRIYPCDGFSYISALIFIAIIGMTLTAGSRYWSTIIKREKEQELLFRGDQIRKAIESYYKTAPGGKGSQYPSSMKDLIKDPRSLTPQRHLRKFYSDPMTENGQWGIIVTSNGRLKGVFSKSKEVPLKSGNFPSVYEDFEKAATYSDWKFVFILEKTKKTSQGVKKP
jgi:type II secretory pathway pseudopilin PulG